MARSIRACAAPAKFPATQNLITDLFEKIVLYDVAITAAQVHSVTGGYEVELDITGKQSKPTTVGVDPFSLMIDRKRADNILRIAR